jgi:iron complex outermembrane receptor protein
VSQSLRYPTLRRVSNILTTDSPVQFALSRPYFCGKIPTISDLGEDIVTSSTTLTPAILRTLGKPTLFRNMLVNNSFNNPLVAKAPSLDHMGLARDTLRAVGQSGYSFANGTSFALNLSHEKSNAIAANDPDRSDQENTYAFVAQSNRAFSAEARLTSAQDQALRWVAGASYFRNSQQSQQLAYQIGQAGGPLPPDGIRNPLTIDKGRVPAVFAAVEYDLSSQFTLSLESRYQKDKSIIAGSTTSFDATTKDWLPRAILQFKPNDTTNLYISYAKAVMPGNPNTSLIVATPSQKADILALFPDASEVAPIPKMKSFEAGVKQRLFDDRVQYSLSAYYMKWRDINTTVSVPVNTTPFFLSVVRSNDANLKGIEFEAEALLTDHWSARIALSLQRDRLTRFFNAILASLTSGVANFVGNVPGRVPERNASFSTEYANNLSGNWDWFIRADANYTGKQYESEANIGYVESHVRVNSRIGIEKDGMRLELFARNLFNDKTWDNAFRSTSISEPGALLLVPFGNPPVLTTVQGVGVGAPDKREIGVKATFDF